MPTGNSQKPPISVEQLLRLKRAERPGSEFWEEFDRELHRRQLAALVGSRPWRARAAGRLMPLLVRAGLPATAAVVLAAGYLIAGRDRSAPTVNTNAATQPVIAAATPGDDGESRVLLLPEQNFVPASPAASNESIAPPAVTVDGSARYVVQDFSPIASLSPQSFVTMSAPPILSAPRTEDDVFVVNALSSGNPLGAPAQKVRQSF